MANQIPIKVMCDGSGNTCGLAQFTSSDSVAIAAGGTGLTSQGICEFVQPGLYAVGCQVTYLGICAGKADTGVGHDNTYAGHSAGTAVTTGCQHTIIGSQAGKAITTCSGTVAIGYNAGLAQTFGDFNTLIGTAGGAAITTASSNTVVGYHAATATICSNNIAIGTCAMVANTQGQDNVAIGVKAGATQVAAGCNNVFVGSNAGAVSLCRDNVSIGSYAGKAATTGGGNVMIGACVGYGVVGGASNVYIGDKAGLANTSGNANVFIGNCAGCATTGSCCLIIGNGACDLITGVFNTGIVSLVSCVGIGTTAPVVAFHLNNGASITNLPASTKAVFSNTSAADAITRVGIYAGGASAYAVLDLGRNDANCRSSLTYNTSADSLTIGTAGATSAAIIDTSGNIGIGTTAPQGTSTSFDSISLGGGGFIQSTHTQAAGNTLALAANAHYDTDNSWEYISTDEAAAVVMQNGCHIFNVAASGTAGNDITWTEAMRISSGGNIGIGTTTPGSTLEVAGGATQKVAEFWGTDTTSFIVVASDAETQNNQSGITFNATTGQTIGSANSAAGIAGKVTNSSGALTADMLFNVNSGDNFAEKMRLSSGGNLGIGTAAPGDLLHLASSGGLSLALQSTHANVANTFKLTVSDPSGTTGTTGSGIAFSSDQCDRGFFFRQDGHVGIGTTAPTQKLDVYAAYNGLPIMTMCNTAVCGRGFMVSAGCGCSDQYLMQLQNIAGGSLFKFTGDGKLGIGTTATETLSLYTSNCTTCFTMISNGNADVPGIKFCSGASRKPLYSLCACWGGGTVFQDAHCGMAHAFQTCTVTRMLVHAGGNIGIGTQTPLAKTRINSDCTSEQVLWPTQNNTSATIQTMQIGTDKSACDTYYLLYMFSSEAGSADSEFSFRSDGNAYADGTWNNSGADYQEYFESDSGSAAEVGRAVVLDTDKVRYYDSKVDSLDDIIGATRPEADNKNSAVIGNTAWNHWTDKYLTDDWGVYLREDISQWTWTETDGTERGVYERDMLRRDPNWKPPAGAVESFHNVRKLNPNYVAPNPENARGEPEDKGYLPRAERDEWWLIGLLGQVQIQAGEATNPRWIKMKNISDAVELWLIR